MSRLVLPGTPRKRITKGRCNQTILLAAASSALLVQGVHTFLVRVPTPASLRCSQSSSLLLVQHKARLLQSRKAVGSTEGGAFCFRIQDMDKRGRPKAARFRGVRHEDVIFPQACFSDRMMAEQDETIVTLQDIDHHAGCDDTARNIAKQCAALIFEGQDEKTRQMIDFYQTKWGPEEARDECESALISLHLNAPGLLEAYCSSFHDGERRDIIHKLSISQLELLLGGKKEGDAREQSYCVYVHAWHGTAGEFSALFESVEIAKGSVSAHTLRSTIRAMPAEESLLLAYVGYTSSTSVQQRYENWGYDYNVLMSALWDDSEPVTLIAFALPETQHQSGGELTSLTLPEFLLVELLGTWSLIGLNQQPGGPGFLEQDWLNYTECCTKVQELGLRTRKEFYSWCKANAEERSKLGIPYSPDQAYKTDGWVNWNAFFGTPPPVRASTQLSYAACSREVQERGLRTRKEFSSWCKANAEERKERGIPYSPDQAYKTDGWVDWNAFFGTPPPVRASTQLSYAACSREVQERGLRTVKEFWSWCKDNAEERRERGIPSNPDQAYKTDGWVDWNAFLGTPPPVRASTQLSYASCSQAVQELGLRTVEEFWSWRKANAEERRELGIPSNPDEAYKTDGWVGWKAFLGTVRKTS